MNLIHRIGIRSICCLEFLGTYNFRIHLNCGLFRHILTKYVVYRGIVLTSFSTLNKSVSVLSLKLKMAKATRQLRHNEEHYVAKMNFRSEKILRSQIERLNKEKLLQVKSLNAQMRTYERKLQKINDRVAEVEKLSRTDLDPSQRLPTREHFNKLNSDAMRQRHLATGVGYSYIDQLLGVSKPLVNRPLRWGINPSLPSLQQQTSKPITLVTDAASSNAFMTEIKGHPIYLRPREAVYIKRQRPTPGALILPPIALKTSGNQAMERQLVLHAENNTMSCDSLPEKDEVTPVITIQDANSQLSPIIEQATEIPKTDDESQIASVTTEGKEKKDHIDDKPNETEPSNIVEKPDVVVESEEPSPVNKETFRSASSSPSSSLRGHFITEYEFPSHGAKRFTRSTEMLSVETGESRTEKYNENEPNSFRYQLHARRFSL